MHAAQPAEDHVSSHLPGPEVVEADVNYLLYTGRRPSSYAYPPPPGVPPRDDESYVREDVELPMTPARRAGWRHGSATSISVDNGVPSGLLAISAEE